MKKPGHMKEQRQKHLNMQARRDALAKLAKGEEINITCLENDKPVVATVVPLQELATYDCVLCLADRRIRVMRVVHRRGRPVVADFNRQLGISSSDIFGRVVLTRPVESEKIS